MNKTRVAYSIDKMMHHVNIVCRELAQIFPLEESMEEALDIEMTPQTLYDKASELRIELRKNQELLKRAILEERRKMAYID